MASKRRYATIAEVCELADVTSTDDSEFEDRISQAEELIDAYVGFQQRSVPKQVRGEVTGVNGATIFDTYNGGPLYLTDGWYVNCTFEIVGGTGAGQSGFIIASSRLNQSITLSAALTTPPDTTSIYRIYQLGKFPRMQDKTTNRLGLAIYKTIPEAVKRAVAAQVAFVIEMGDDYFAGDGAVMDSESLLNYSYSKSSGAQQSALVKMIAPRAQVLLRGIMNRTGQLQAENPTTL